MKTNRRVVKPAVKSVGGTPVTHEGAPAARIEDAETLRRSVMACLLWEDTFYEDGREIADRIRELVPLVAPETVAALAVEARGPMNLRHVPLLLVATMAGLATHKHLVADTLYRVIQRPDELAEYVAVYRKLNGAKAPLSAQSKKGLAGAFGKFNEYQLVKWRGEGQAMTLRDVMFLTHPRPTAIGEDAEAVTVRGGNKVKRHHGPTGNLYRAVAENTLATPGTWENRLSAGEDKNAVFTELVLANKLGALAMLRNLRNMIEAGVHPAVIQHGLANMNTERVLPFRFIAAARFAPQFEPDLEAAMFRTIAESGIVLGGRTILLVDISGSMNAALSGKSDMARIDAACGLAMVLREVCANLRVFSFSDKTVEVPSRRGFALRDAINASQAHSSTYLGAAVNHAGKVGADRLVVISDEQSHDRVIAPANIPNRVMINVGAYRNGVGYGDWLHIDGFSEAVVRYLAEVEAANRPAPPF